MWLKKNHKWAWIILFHSIPSIGWSNTVSVTLADQTKLDIHIELPKMNVTQQKFPAFLVFGGFETGGKVLSLIKTSEPVILATFDYPYEGKRRIRTLEAIREAKKIKHAVRKTESAILEMIQAIKRHPNVDPNRIAIVGASFGAPFAVFAASESSDIRGLVLVHGFADIESILKHRLSQIWKKHIHSFSDIAATIAAKIIVYWINPPEPAEYAKKLRSDQLVLLIEPKIDSFVPMKSRIALDQSLRQSMATIHSIQTDGDHLHPSAKNLIQNIIHQTVVYFKKQGWF